MGSNEKIIKIHQVVEIVGISRSSIYDMVQRGDFPKQVKLGVRSSGWLKSEVDCWIELRASLRFTGGSSCCYRSERLGSTTHCRDHS